jgi:hypothetical protein
MSGVMNQLRALAARIDPPAGEPVPLPEPEVNGTVTHATLQICYTAPVHYTAAQMLTHREEYAETVAAPLRERNQRAELALVEALKSEQAAIYRAVTAERERGKARASRDFYQRRCNMLQAEQRRMRDPERTLVCDILANGQLLPDPHGKRYGDIDSAMGDSKTTVAEDVEALRKISDSIGGKGDG